MSLSVLVKLVDLKRKKWQSKTCSKLQNTRLHQCLPGNFSRVFSSLRFRRKQEKGGKNPRCSETAIVVEIPDDLVEEILHRLPVKSLVRLKSVSKLWKSLIESEHAAEKLLRHRQKKYGVEEMKITFEWSIPRSFRIKYLSKYNRESETNLRVAGSCNGLVCLYDLAYVYLIDPKARMFGTLAPPPQGGSKLSLGFGRDVVTRRYKVVIVYGFDYDDRVETMVFELGTSSEWRWRHETAGPMPLSYTPFTLIDPERNAVFANGSLFWLLTRYHSEILVMDLHSERFRTLSQPKDIISTMSLSGSIYMWSFEDRLCVSELRQGLDSDVWVLVQDEVSERWEKTRFPWVDALIPPLELNSVWFSQSLGSPYVEPALTRSWSSMCLGTRKTCLTIEAILISEIVRSSPCRNVLVKGAGLVFESIKGFNDIFF